MSQLTADALNIDGWPRLWCRRSAVAAIVLAFLAGLFLVVQHLASRPSTPPTTPTVIHILDPLPPDRENKPPEITKPVIKEVPTAAPIDSPPKPPGEPLKIDEPGSDKGLDGTQSGPVTDPNHFPTTSGGNGGLGFGWYGAAVQHEVQRYLRKRASLGNTNYMATVRVWLSAGGEVTRVEIATSSGSGEIDEILRVALEHMPALKERPPSEMPQPIRLRVNSRS
jgi:TonB family protein